MAGVAGLDVKPGFFAMTGQPVGPQMVIGFQHSDRMAIDTEQLGIMASRAIGGPASGFYAMQRPPIERVDGSGEIVTLVAETAEIVGPVAAIAIGVVNVCGDSMILPPADRVDRARDYIRIGMTCSTLNGLPNAIVAPQTHTHLG